MTLPADDPSFPLVINSSAGTADDICLLEPMSTMVYDSNHNLDSTIDPMGNASAATYDGDNRPITTLQGQVLPAGSTSHAASFENVPQAPGLVRTVQVFAESSDDTTSHYSFADTAGSLTRSGTASTSTLFFESGWSYLGYLTIPASDTSSTVTVTYSGSGSVSQFAILIQTGTITYNSEGEVLSDVDGLNWVTASAYDSTSLLPTNEFQGQINPVASASATFSNLPQTPGKSRTYYVFGQAALPTFTVSDSDSGTVTKDTAAVYTDTLGSGWQSWGTVTLAAGDTSDSLSFGGVSGSANICIVTQVEGISYTGNLLPAAETDADGGVYTFVYDFLNDETSVELPNQSDGTAGGPTTTIAYDTLQRPTGTIDPNGNVTTRKYDLDAGGEAGLTITTAQGPSAAVSSDSATFNDLAQNPGNDRVYTVYVQSSGTVTDGSISASDGYSGTQPSFASSTVTPLGSGWYSIGTLTLVADDGSSDLTASGITLTGGSATRIALVSQAGVSVYDPNSNLLSSEDALGNTTSFTYNAVNEPSQQTDPTDGITQLGPLYDPAGYTIEHDELANREGDGV